jgi:chromosome segregation ATPase
MEFEEIVKRVEWLDEQQRKSKSDLKDLNGRITSSETTANALGQQLKTLSQQMSDLSVAAARINQFDQMMTKQRADLAKMIEAMEKSTLGREHEMTNNHHASLEDIRKSLLQIGGLVTASEATKKDRVHEEQRRDAAVQDLRAAVEAVERKHGEILNSHKTLEENRRREAKLLADLQGELAAVRKRTDEAREKTTLQSDSIRNLENRMNELLEAETGRQERHGAFLQQLALVQVERDRAWKEWQDKYEAFNQQAGSAESQVAAFEESVRSAQKAQEAYDGLNQRLERRISEVGEIQRLAEERIRQEWVAFKADEQKRWAGHALAQDESIRDLRKDADKMEKRLTAIDDATQTMQDQLQQTTETTEKQLQELMNVSQEWLSAYERIMGHAKAKARKAVR